MDIIITNSHVISWSIPDRLQTSSVVVLSLMALRCPLRFIKGKADYHNVSNEETASGTETRTLTGDEAMTFYQDIISTQKNHQPELETASCEEQRLRRTSIKRKGKCRKSASLETKHCLTRDEAETALLFGSQHGDEEMVKKAIASGSCDVNCVDSFLWTALMCACQAGHARIAEILLESGASWRNNVDKCGRNALDLAQLSGFSDIVVLLRGSCKDVRGGRRRKRARTKPAPYWCSECDLDVTDGIRHEHRNSTVHQFSSRHRTGVKPRPHYVLKHSNVGYQMMLRDGWTDDKGLGADSQGRWYPIKTVLKRDRKGLGAVCDSPRVTHFRPFDATAVEGSSAAVDAAKQMTKKDFLRNRERDRQLEISFRRSFNSIDA